MVRPPRAMFFCALGALAIACAKEDERPAPSSSGSAASSARPTSSASSTRPMPYGPIAIPAESWRTLAPEGAGFSVRMPGEVETRPTPGGATKYGVPLANRGSFAVECLALSAGARQAELEAFEKRAFHNIEEPKRTEVEVGGAPGLEVVGGREAQDMEYEMHVRVLRGRTRACLFETAFIEGIDQEKDIRTFLDSARIVE